MPKENEKQFVNISAIDPEYYRLAKQVRSSRKMYFESSEELKRLHALGWEVTDSEKRQQMKYVEFWIMSWQRWFDRLEEYKKRKGI